eukprot:3738543-Prymnesium_polylepis.1
MVRSGNAARRGGAPIRRSPQPVTMSGGRSRRHHRARWPGRWLGAALGAPPILSFQKNLVTRGAPCGAARAPQSGLLAAPDERAQESRLSGLRPSHTW